MLGKVLVANRGEMDFKLLDKKGSNDKCVQPTNQRPQHRGNFL